MDRLTPKRKQSPSSYPHERPYKQARRPSASDMANGLMLPNGHVAPSEGKANGHSSPPPDDELDMQGVVHAAAAPETVEWQATIERVVSNVVSIHFSQTCAFDTDGALSSQATGFVVDAERGYILTNRHVVGAGPFWGYCIFDNHEECDVHPVYRDPVHDFGILRFDPKAIKYMPLSALDLRPEFAKVGVEIRVVGNDAGEKLSILSGVISRLDRNAPEYGEGYSDFNTNYIQAAASATGGSSGSPVINIDGYAIALQAGGRCDGAATDFFLPLDRPLRALRCVQEGRPITRGTIQTQWLLKPFDECRRLGLTPEWEGRVREEFPKETGMLVAECILPKGPGHEKLEEGDVLVKVNDQMLTQFIRLDDILDSSVGSKIKLLFLRGGVEKEAELDVEDLHSITPDRFVSVAGASFHDLSYQQARLYAVALKDAGTYCCNASGSFKLDGSDYGWLLQSIDGKPTPNLQAFIAVMKTIPDRARVAVTYKHLHHMHTLNNSIIQLDRHWHKHMRMAIRNDETGLWDFSDLSDPLPPVPITTKRANFTQMSGYSFPAAVDVIRSFVKVSTYMPLSIDGFPLHRKTSYGVVIDADKGLVIVSRAVVPYDMCDITITVADSIIVPGRILFLHPLQNYAIVQYDPSLVQAPVKSAVLSSTPLKQGEEVIFFGYNQNLRPVAMKTAVTDVNFVTLPTGGAPPRYRAVNFDSVTVDTSLGGSCGSGVLVKEDGTVHALWMTFFGERYGSGRDVEYHLGMATPGLLPVIDAVRSGRTPDLRILSFDLQTVHMSQARILGVNEDWISRVENENPEHHQLFMVRKVDAGSHTEASGLHEGDVILTLNGKLCTETRDMDIMYDLPTLTAVIVRKQVEVTLMISTFPTAHLETDAVLSFCGALIHKPHHAVRQQISELHSEIYVSNRSRGSPAYSYGLGSMNFIRAVNGVETVDLDSFITEANKIPDNTYFRLKVVTFDKVPWVCTMKKCEWYFPTVLFTKEKKAVQGQRETPDQIGRELGWKRVTFEGGKIKRGEGEVASLGAEESGAGTEVAGEPPEAGDGGDGGNGIGEV